MCLYFLKVTVMNLLVNINKNAGLPFSNTQINGVHNLTMQLMMPQGHAQLFKNCIVLFYLFDLVLIAFAMTCRFHLSEAISF